MLLILAGCMPPIEHSHPAGEAFIRQTVEFTHEVQFVADRSQLSPETKRALLAFLADTDPKGGGRIILDAAGSHADERIDVVSGLLAPMARTPERSYTGSAGPHAVAVVVAQEVVIPRACLEVDQTAPIDALPATGCANALNLARLAEQQSDLSQGRDMGPAPAWLAVDSIRRSYERQPSP